MDRMALDSDVMLKRVVNAAKQVLNWNEKLFGQCVGELTLRKLSTTGLASVLPYFGGSSVRKLELIGCELDVASLAATAVQKCLNDMTGLKSISYDNERQLPEYGALFVFFLQLRGPLEELTLQLGTQPEDEYELTARVVISPVAWSGPTNAESLKYLNIGDADVSSTDKPVIAAREFPALEVLIASNACEHELFLDEPPPPNLHTLTLAATDRPLRLTYPNLAHLTVLLYRGSVREFLPKGIQRKVPQLNTVTLLRPFLGRGSDSRSDGKVYLAIFHELPALTKIEVVGASFEVGALQRQFEGTNIRVTVSLPYLAGVTVVDITLSRPCTASA